MKTNAKTIKYTKKPNPKLYTLKRASIEAKKPTLIYSNNSTNKPNAKDKRVLPGINSHRLSASQKTMTKLEIEVKEKPKEDEDSPSIDAKEDKDNLSAKLSELETELKKLNDESIKIKSIIALNEKKNINILRDIDNRDNFISMKNHKLSKLKKENVKLKGKLEEINNKSKEEVESFAQNETNEDANPIDELFFRLMASCQYARDEEEEERPLATEIIDQIPVLSYNTNSHTNLATKCLLCNFELCANDLIMQIPACLHIFHNACLVNYFQKNNICPSCKKEVKDS